MDPNANIQEQEQILIRRTRGDWNMVDTARLRELRAALRDWLDGGGFAPAWETCPRVNARRLCFAVC